MSRAVLLFSLVSSLAQAQVITPADPADEAAVLQRRSGFKVGVLLGAGFSGLVGVPVSYGWKWASLYAMPQGQFQWPFVFTTSAFFFGVDAGVMVHLGRRFSFGAGGLVGIHAATQQPTGGFSVTPVMVHLGEREQHGLSIYVPVVFNVFHVVPLPMLGYSFRFN